MPVAAVALAMEFWSIVFVVGAAQAALLAVALWRWPINIAGNRVLAVWIALIGIDLAVKSLYFHAPGVTWFKPYRLVGLFPFLYGSFFYLYVRALTESRALARRDWVHFVGFAVAVLLNADVFLHDRAQTQALVAHLHAGGTWPRSPWLDIALFGYGLSYVIAALLRVRRYRLGLLQRRADADRMWLRWIDAMAIAQILVWCIALARWLFRIPWIDYPLIYGGVVAWVFVMGYMSLRQSVIAVAPPSANAVVADTHAGNGSGDAGFAAVEARLAQLMAQDQLYREPALTIGQLAKRSGYPEHLVSAVINRRSAGHFWDYIARYRVEAARACLADADDTRAILDIAYACGFTAKSTFNAAFKRQLGLTPGAYRQRHAHAAPASAVTTRTQAD